MVSSPHVSLRVPGLTFVVLGALAALPAHGDTYEELLRNSPFGSPSSVTSERKTSAAVEFRGVVIDGKDRIFSVHDRTARRAYWLRENESEGDIHVRSYHAESGVIEIVYSGQVMTLPLKQAEWAATTGPGLTRPSPATAPTDPVSDAQQSRRVTLATFLERSRNRGTTPTTP